MDCNSIIRFSKSFMRMQCAPLLIYHTGPDLDGVRQICRMSLIFTTFAVLCHGRKAHMYLSTVAYIYGITSKLICRTNFNKLWHVWLLIMLAYNKQAYSLPFSIFDVRSCHLCNIDYEDPEDCLRCLRRLIAMFVLNFRTVILCCGCCEWGCDKSYFWKAVPRLAW